MSRDYRLFIEDILISIDKIEKYTKDMTIETFEDSSLIQDAVVRNFEIIGEATVSIPDEIKNKYNEIKWRILKDFRNVMIHHYFGVDIQIVWEIIQKELPELKKMIIKILSEVALDEEFER